MTSATRSVDVAIIGAGTAGLYALREVRKAKCSAVLIDHGPLGTTCARVGCMPSKAALHVAHLWQAAQEAVRFGYPAPDSHRRGDRAAAWAEVRRKRDFFAGRTAERTRQFAGNDLLIGSARFLSPTAVKVTHDDGETTVVEAKAFVLAVGSRPFLPPTVTHLDGAKLLTTDTLFEIDEPPARIGIVGLGAIGIEMGLALARLGVEVVGVDVAPTLAGISDPEVRRVAHRRFSREFPLHLNAAATFRETADGIVIELASGERYGVDALLVATGRRSNLDRVDLPAAGVALNERSFPTRFSPETLQVGDAPIFVAGDANSLFPLMHEAALEGGAAGRNAALVARGEKPVTRKTVPPLAIVFSDPDVVRVGARFTDLNPEEIVIGTGKGEENGRSRVLDETETLVRVYAEKGSGKILGAEMVCAHGEHLGHFLAQAIARGATVVELLALPYYHPTVEELLQSALQDAQQQQLR
ncbi:dihydrolipoyl dehydrogenase [Hydrogenophilus islandicus]